MRLLYHRQDEVPGAQEIIRNAVEDENGQVRLWAVSCLAQKGATDSIITALKALDHPVDEALDFALWSIVREHEAHWAPQVQAGEKVFGEKVNHLLYAIGALGKPMILDDVFAALKSGELAEAERKKAIATIGKVGSAKDLGKLLEMAIASEKVAVINAVTEALRVRKVRPASGLEVVSEIVEKKSGAFQQAAVLAGMLKLENSRGALEREFGYSWNVTFLRAAAAEGLRHLGGAKAVRFFEEAAQESPDDWAKGRAVKELASLNPQRAAKAAVALLQKDEKGEDRFGLLEVFLQNPRASTALAKALEGQNVPTQIANLGVQRAGTSGRPPEDLIAAFRKAGNLKPMAQKLSDAQMLRMVKLVATEGNAHRGEDIYRRPALQCVMCHAIGGAGGVIGPDMVSIGASAPVDYLVTSLLNPGDKIKEGYHTTMVTMKDGNMHTGALVSEGDQETVLRDFSGKELRLPTGEIAKKVISPISMMPPRLTASLREDEFVDLVKFLSELGKEGEFKTTARPLVRNWQALQPHKRTRDEMGQYGASIFAERDKTYQWTPMVSRVDGSIQPAELPKVLGRGRNLWGVLRFGIGKTGSETTVLKINETKLMHLFDGEKKIELPRSGPATIEVTAGDAADRFTIAVNSAFRKEAVLVEIAE